MPKSSRRPPCQSTREITHHLVRDDWSVIPPDINHDAHMRLAFAVWDGIGDSITNIEAPG